MVLADRRSKDDEKDSDTSSDEIVDDAECTSWSTGDLKYPSKDSNQNILPNNIVTKTLCNKCQKRRAKLSCCELACLYCCTSDQCEGHSSYRSGRMLERQLLDGTHWCVKLASELRAKAVKKGAFKEKAIHYLEETCLVWDIDQFEKLADEKNDRIFRGRSALQGPQVSTGNNCGTTEGEISKNLEEIQTVLASKRQRVELRRAQRFRKLIEERLKG
jgi:hypothetical protein